jgi:type II secretory pathway pseudopilin PulG
MRALFAILILFAAAAAAADLSAVMAEANLEKRSEKALKHADAVLDEARKAYKSGHGENLASLLAEILESVELAKKSLDESGKNARRSPKYFKRAEIAIRKLNRRLDNFRIEMSVDEREPVEKIMQRASQIRDEIIMAIMGRKK